MKSILLVCKISTALFWVAVLVSLFPLLPELVATVLGWAGAAVLLIHSVEVMIVARSFAGGLAKPKPHKAMVLVFGLFYLWPFMCDVE